MQRPVITVMSALSLAVVGLSLRASTEGQVAAVPVAASGIVGQVQQPSTHAAPLPLAGAAVPPAAPAPAATAAKGLLPATAGANRSTPQRAVVAVPTAAPSNAQAARPVTPAPAPAASHAPRTVTVNGSPASTQYGPVQVQITLTNGRITAAKAITYPRYDHREQQINDPAIPQLNQEALQAQSATIDTVSGATYTSEGYQQSLQSALDAAHAG